MIEDNIRVLRQAARITSNNDYEIEKTKKTIFQKFYLEMILTISV